MSILSGLRPNVADTYELDQMRGTDAWNAALSAVAKELANPTNDQVTVIASRAWAAGNYVSPSVVRAVLAAAAGGER